MPAEIESAAGRNAEIVPVGRIAGAYGVAGEVRVSSSTQPPENLVRYRPWLIRADGAWRDVKVLEVRGHGEGFVARLEGVADRDAAQRLSGSEIGVPRNVFPALESSREYYWQDLIGLAVINDDGTPLGVVESLLETGAHDVLVIARGAHRTLVPFADPFLVEVDVPGGRIRVAWQEPV